MLHTTQRIEGNEGRGEETGMLVRVLGGGDGEYDDAC